MHVSASVKHVLLLFWGGLNDEAKAGTGSCRWGHTPLQHAVSRRHGPAIEVMQKYDARLG